MYLTQGKRFGLASGRAVQWHCIAALACFIGSMCGAGRCAAQGLSGASLSGTVVTSAGREVAGASISIIELNTGAGRVVVSGASGGYGFESLPVGRYRVEARAIGFSASQRDTVELHLGDWVRHRMVLTALDAQELRAIEVRSAELRNPGAGGPSSTIPRAAIRYLPLLNRDFTGLFSISSHASGPGALWVSGQHQRFNAIQVDGAVHNDLFGVNLSAGSGAGGRSLSLEALEEIRVLVAPFDVRQGGFSGGSINAITRSGSNKLRVTGFSSLARSEFVGADTAGFAVPAFDQVQYGVSISGPVVRNKLHFFATAEWQSRSFQIGGVPATDSNSVVHPATAERISDAIQTRFGFNPGDASAPPQRQPNDNVFVKLSWFPSLKYTLELATSLTNASSESLVRTSTASAIADGWQLSNSGNISHSRTRGVRLKFLTAGSSVTNEATVSLRTTNDVVGSRQLAPLFLIGADRAANYVAAGSVKGAQNTRTDQRVYEIADNISVRAGRHLLSFGSQNVFLHVHDTFFLGSWGVWTFANVDSLEKGVANNYEVAQPRNGRGVGPIADYNAALLSGYVQDQWQVNDRFTLTGGVRLDAPLIDTPASNASLARNSLFGINTSEIPSGKLTVAPRLAFAMELGATRRTLLRGGVGRFSGRPPFAWLTTAFANTGQEQELLSCNLSAGVPTPTVNVRALPSSCTKNTAPGRPSVSWIDPSFRFQRATKYALGMDRQVGRGIQASFDFVHTATSHSMFVTDLNLRSTGTNADGRAMYGIPSQNGTTPDRLDKVNVDAVYRFSNTSSERSTSASLSLLRTWSDRGFVQMGYSWSNTSDVLSGTGFTGPILMRNNPIDGSLAHRNLRRSARDVPHTFVLAAVAPLGERVTASLLFRARSGTPFALVPVGDANGDGVQRNDLMYIPRDAGDVLLNNPTLFSQLNSWLAKLPCAARQRGHIMTRNSCRNAPIATLDGRLARRVLTRAGGFEFSADLFNIPNMVNRNWGLVRETAVNEFLTTVNIVGYDGATNRTIYRIQTSPTDVTKAVLPPIDRVNLEASRWRLQVGLRFDY